MNLNNLYNQLTNVDINDQIQLWNDRGKGYYGEFLVFGELYKNIPGNCKILMNLNLPTKNLNTTEIDLILIHETGIYVFEIKHYKGTIYGTDTDNTWTQYFRTTKNVVFKNPILQNAYHICALKDLFNNIPIKSIIVFTNEDCKIKVTNNNQNVSICTLYNLTYDLNQIFKNSEQILSKEEIDIIFNELSQYSQMKEIISYNGEEKSFIEWLQPLIEKIKDIQYNLNNQMEIHRKNNNKRTIITLFVILICIISTIFAINGVKDIYNNKLEKFKQNFKHIDEIDNEYITKLNEYFSASDVMIDNISSNAVTFTAKISKNNDVYGMLLTQNSKYIVMTTNGKIFEYNVFGEHLKYNRYTNMIGKGIRDFGHLGPAQFHGVTKEEIEYIKITNIELFKLDMYRSTIKKNLELELFSK